MATATDAMALCLCAFCGWGPLKSITSEETALPSWFFCPYCQSLWNPFFNPALDPSSHGLATAVNSSFTAHLHPPTGVKSMFEGAINPLEPSLGSSLPANPSAESLESFPIQAATQTSSSTSQSRDTLATSKYTSSGSSMWNEESRFQSATTQDQSPVPGDKGSLMGSQGSRERGLQESGHCGSLIDAVDTVTTPDTRRIADRTRLFPQSSNGSSFPTTRAAELAVQGNEISLPLDPCGSYQGVSPTSTLGEAEQDWTDRGSRRSSPVPSRSYKGTRFSGDEATWKFNFHRKYGVCETCKIKKTGCLPRHLGPALRDVPRVVLDRCPRPEWLSGSI